MHPKQHARQLLWGLAALLLMTGGTAKAQPPQPTVDRIPPIIVPVGGAVRLQMKTKKPIKQVFNDKPNILSVDPDAVNPNYLVLRGIDQGTSRIELTDIDGAKEIYDVVVQADLDLLRSIVRRAVPTSNVDFIPFGKGVVVTGTVAQPADASTIMMIAARMFPAAANPNGTAYSNQQANVVNAMTVGGVNQVQLDVTVARVDRTKSRSRGVNFIINGTTVSTGSVLGGLTSQSGSSGNSTVATGVGIIPGAASALPTSTPNLILGVIPANFQFLLQALKTEGLAKLIAEPKLVTQSGKPAMFLSGGQQATLSAASGVNGPGVAYQDIGTSIEFLPIVYGNGKIYLEVAPRVRAVNTGLGVTTSFGTVPGFDDQSVRTSVVMESGQTFAIGGLIQTNVQSSASRVPFLGELPLVGFFFSTVSETLQEQELVILVTPHLVDPMDCNQIPKRLPGTETRSPDDYEIFLESMLELPRGQRNIFEGHHYKGAWKNDPTAANYPCGYGLGAGGNNCNTGSCSPNPAMKYPGLINPTLPSPGTAAIGPNELPPGVQSPLPMPMPMVLPAPPRDR
jgi:pilus assembly protein CpaC